MKLFAIYREKAGATEIKIDVPDSATVGSLAEVIVHRFPAIIGDPAKLVVAVNQEYVDHGHVLVSGDEVALIPPVSGGSV